MNKYEKFYESGEIKSTINWFDNGSSYIKKKFHKNGQLKSEVPYADAELLSLPFIKGFKKGYGKFYYENGQIKKEGNYEMGVAIGLWKYYYPNGKLKKRGEFLKRYFNEGVEMGALHSDEDGYFYEESYDENGFYEGDIKRKDFEGLFSLRNGLWVEYYDNGMLKSKKSFLSNLKEMITVERIVGVWEFWDKNGKRKEELDVKKKKLKRWYENGQLKEEAKLDIKYYDNMSICVLSFCGNRKEWCENGNLKSDFVVKDWDHHREISDFEEGNFEFNSDDNFDLDSKFSDTLPK